MHEKSDETNGKNSHILPKECYQSVVQKRLTNLIASTPCINAANSQINKCYSNLIDKILGAQNVNETRRIPHVCCEYYKFFPCVATRTKRISVCTEFHISTASDFVRSLSGNKQ